MDVRSQLKNAQLEQRATNPTKKGETVIQTADSNQVKYHDGTNVRTVVNTDQAQTLTNKTIVAASNTVTTAASGNLAATELNAALSELQTDIDSKGAAQTAHAASTTTHGVSGDIVGTTDVQTLTNKGLTSPIITTQATFTNQAEVRLGDGATNYTGFKAPATVGSNTIYTMPTADGSSGQLLSTNGTKTLSWTSPGAVSLSVVSKTAAYTATTSDDVILCDASSAAFTITLYAASGNAGKQIIIKKTDSSFNLVTVESITLATQGDTAKYVSDGTSWQLIERTYPRVWTTYSMTIQSSGTVPTKASSPVIDQAQWMRIADDTIVTKYDYQHTNNTGAAAGSGVYGFSLPSGLTMDTTKAGDGSGAPNFGGSAVAFVTGSNGGIGTAIKVGYSSTAVGLYVAHQTTNATTIGSTFFAISAATVQYSFRANVPISGWS